MVWILDPLPGLEPVTPYVVETLNHWTAREGPGVGSSVRDSVQHLQ